VQDGGPAQSGVATCPLPHAVASTVVNMPVQQLSAKVVEQQPWCYFYSCAWAGYWLAILVVTLWILQRTPTASIFLVHPL
jgi:hypothetical protein